MNHAEFSGFAQKNGLELLNCGWVVVLKSPSDFDLIKPLLYDGRVRAYMGFRTDDCKNVAFNSTREITKNNADGVAMTMRWAFMDELKLEGHCFYVKTMSGQIIETPLAEQYCDGIWEYGRKEHILPSPMPVFLPWRSEPIFIRKHAGWRYVVIAELQIN